MDNIIKDYKDKTVSDYIVDRLMVWKVQRVFGYPGDGING